MKIFFFLVLVGFSLFGEGNKSYPPMPITPGPILGLDPEIREKFLSQDDLEEKWREKQWAFVYAGLWAFLLANGVLVYFFSDRLKRKKSPWERALEALGEEELDSVWRRYVEEAYGVKTATKTNGEMISEVGGLRALSEEERKTFIAFLQDSDLVKFARQRGNEELAEKVEGYLRSENL